MSLFRGSSDHESVYEHFYETYQLLCSAWENHKGHPLTQAQLCQLLDSQGISISQSNLCKLLSQRNKKQEKLISITQSMKRLLDNPRNWSGHTLLLTNWGLQQKIQAGKQGICLILSCPELLLSLQICLEEAIRQGAPVQLLLPHPCSPHILFAGPSGARPTSQGWPQVLNKLWELAKRFSTMEIRLGLLIPTQNKIQIDGCLYRQHKRRNAPAEEGETGWDLIQGSEDWSIDFAKNWEQAVSAKTIFEANSEESAYEEKDWHLFRAFYVVEKQTETFLMHYHPGSRQVILSQTASKESFCGALIPSGSQSLIILQTSPSNRLRNADLLADTGTFRLEDRGVTLAVFNRTGIDQQLHSGRLLLVQITGEAKEEMDLPAPWLLNWLQDSGEMAEVLSISRWPNRKASA